MLAGVGEGVEGGVFSNLYPYLEGNIEIVDFTVVTESKLRYTDINNL